MTSRARLVLWIAQVDRPCRCINGGAGGGADPNGLTPAGRVTGFPFDTSAIDLASFGYTEQEFFISGNAQAFVNSGTLGNDGVWNVSPGATAPYVTRMLVRTPTDPERFNGTVVVEWLNVSGGVDATPEWDYAHVELAARGLCLGRRNGAVRRRGVPAHLRQRALRVDLASWRFMVVRYLFPGGHGHPARQPPAPRSADAVVRTLLAEGESQSASRMFTYYNAIQPLARVYQGFLIHSTGSGAALSQSFAAVGVLGGASVPAPPACPRRRISRCRRLRSSAGSAPAGVVLQYGDRCHGPRCGLQRPQPAR